MDLCSAHGDDPWVVYEGADGPGKGKHVVLVSGDEEYRSEEALPQLGKILAKRHGFKCTVLFADRPEGRHDQPERQNDNIPGLEALETADLMIIATRFRDLPDEQMKHIVDYVESGRPIIGMRTATHAFNIAGGQDLQQVRLATARSGKAASAGRCSARPGSATTAHHGKQSTRGIIAPARRTTRSSAASRTATSGARPTSTPSGCRCPATASRWCSGQVLDGHEADDKPVDGQEERPDDAGRLDQDLSPARRARPAASSRRRWAPRRTCASEGMRRLLVNAAYWAVGLEDKIPAKGERRPRRRVQAAPFGFGTFKKAASRRITS